jgi:hypothetical protein
MKNYLTVQPEVIVGLGANTEFKEKSQPFKTVTTYTLTWKIGLVTI